VTTSLERKIPLVTIRAISMTNLRDDFVALNVNACEEGDPIFTCVLKTEMMCVILTLTGGNMSVNIGPTIDYAKKKDKRAVIKTQRDEAIRGDAVYKSSTITVGSGESPNSVSAPQPPRKPKVKKAAKAAPAGMAGRSSARPAAKALPGATKPSAPPVVAAMTKTSTAAPVSASARAPPSIPGATARAPPAIPGAAARAPPPPPPPPPAASAPKKQMYKALYNFAGQEGEIQLVKGEEVEVKEKDDNGWWMVVKNGQEGWAPSNYLKLIEQHTAPPPPPPAARRPPPAPAPPVSNGVSKLNGASSSPASTPGNSRPNSMIGNKGPAPAPKPKPVIPAKPSVGAKPPIGGGGGGGKPPIPSAPRVQVPAAMGKAVGGAPPKAPAGQLDLAAALAKRAQRAPED